ncbi:MAG TPA: DUF6624 domain-containing protein [Chthonomonadaceae bacterium]|nr:DUF6624 domain-containing protein [Chthonomonadaceae bacterium]
MIRFVTGALAFFCLAAALLPGRSQTTPPAPKQLPPVKNEALRQELLHRYKVDQDARMKFLDWMRQQRVPFDAKTWQKTDVPAIKQMEAVDKDNTAWMKAVVAKYGWPGISLVGKDGSQAAWLLVQHADRDRAFQKHCLQLMQEADKKGDVDKTELAYLTDRVLVGEHKKQIYGTQLQQKNGEMLPSPIEDEANVDKRRAAMGMEPLADYLKMSRDFYTGKKK